MLGNDLFKVEVNVDLGYKRNKSLVLFYNPLIGNDAHYLYEFLCIKGSSSNFEELNKLLNSLRYTIENFEESLRKLNEYRLIKTLKKKDEDKYIFVVNNPLSVEEFVNDDLLVRDFILKTSGQYYQMLVSDIRTFSKHKGFEDVSYKFNVKELETWSKEDESFLVNTSSKTEYKFDTFFDVNILLSDMSNTLFPLKYRTPENLKEIATLADLYNISYDKMRVIISKVLKSDSSSFDLNLLKYKCQTATSDYRFVENGVYDIPCELFLTNKQEGREVSPYDKKIIYKLSSDYHLKPSVINVLLEHCLNNCNNALIETYIYPIASNLHRNNCDSVDKALSLLNVKTNKKNTYKEEEIKYDGSNNPEYSQERKEALRKRRSQNV